MKESQFFSEFQKESGILENQINEAKILSNMGVITNVAETSEANLDPRKEVSSPDIYLRKILQYNNKAKKTMEDVNMLD